MKKISLIISAAICLAASSAKAADSLTMADFNHSIKLQVDGYTGSETLVNFPVLVRISESGIPGFLYSDLSNSSGKDIAFFDEAGNHLPSEIQTNSWKATDNESQAWVLLPQMTQGTKFYMCYNTSESGVWVTNANPWTEYVGVWHLDEKGGTSKPVYDSTTNALNGITSAKGSPAVYASGKVGKARRIATDTNNNPGYDCGITVAITNDAVKKAVVDGLTPQFTASFWYLPAAAKANYEYLLSRKSADGYNAWGLQFGMTNTTSVSPWNQIRVWGGNSGNYAVGTGATYGTGDQYGMVIPESNTTTWRKMDCVWTSDKKYSLYVDGVLVAAGALSGNKNAVNGSLNLSIGGTLAPASGKGGRGFNGYMDEVRVRVGTRSADWIKADYDTVNNASFVTVAPPEVTWANGESGTPGLTEVGVDTVVFSGSVTDCGGFATCEIQCKVWATDGSEPEEWTTITNDLVATDAFSVVFPGLAASMAYNYALRAVGDDGSTASAVVSGSFTLLGGLGVTWSDAESGAMGLSSVGYNSAIVAGTVVGLGGAASCGIECKVWPTSGSEPENWTTLTNGLVISDTFSVTVPGLSSLTAYSYALRVAGNDGATTTPVTGTFTTAPGLTVTWANNSGAMPGISQVSYDFAKVGGTVTALGGAMSCDIQGKFWPVGGSEPEWTTLKTGLALNDDFQAVVTNLTAGTTYNYALRASGDNEDEATPVTGTFTTRGEAGETIGSKDTFFFTDGTNAYWVAKDFERYLPFTVTGYTGTETLTNFPVLVDVRKDDTNGFTYDDFYRFDGEDIAFVDDKGRVIPHEIDTWNPNGMTLIWVRLPEMVNGTTFTMCYRSPLLNPPSDPGNVFEKYVGVWHMNEKSDGIVDVIDSTTNNLIGETHAQSLASSNGRIGGARRVAQHSGTSSTYGHIIVPDHDDILRTGVGNTFTYSCWSKLVDDKPGWAYLVSRKSEDSDKGWGIQYHDDKDSTKQIRVWSGKDISADKNDCTLLNISNYSHDNWACWTFVYDNTNCTAYLDGEKLKTVVLEGRISHTVWPVANDETATYDGLVIGGQEVGTGALNGWVDECRYSKGIRSADWIKAEYDSSLQVNTPFVTKGTQVGRGKESLVPVVVWETGDGMPETVIDVSYAYVQFAGTVTYCGAGTNECRVEYQLWADGEEQPGKDDWKVLLDNATVGTKFSLPVFGLKQDMPYNYRIRAANDLTYWDEEQQIERQQTTHEHTGSFRTNGNVNESGSEGELLRVDNKFVHKYRAGTYTFTTPDYVTNISIIVVGGGGAGGYQIGGGGGGGGVYYSQSYAVTTNTTYHITVGRGGIAPTNTTTVSSAGNGEYSTFALTNDLEHPLISVPGGGGGGSCCSTNANIVNGYEGASGGGAGGRNDTSATGATGGSAISDSNYGRKGGNGNHSNGKTGSAGAYAAGGGGGGRTVGLSASSDKYYGGGGGGSGISCNMLGETLYFGAGGGGGYAYFEDGTGFSKPGAGGSGIGGNAADVKNGTLATSGVENTGAGGGGGSKNKNNNNNPEYWQGGDGGDGVVIISYEVHGRDPVADEPRVSMTSCNYDEDEGMADIVYRVYWAGMQNDLTDILIHYSTVSSNELDSVDAGNWIKIAESRVGTGSAVFVPPEVGYTYWLRLVARKDANSYSHSEEIACFEVPAIEINGAIWTESKTSPTGDYATVSYKLFETNEVTHLYCYWSESREALEGDETPSGDNVYLLDLGANTGEALSSATSFTLPATEGLVRNRTYYLRLACGDAQGLKHFLSDNIEELDTAEKLATVLNGASWEDCNVATVEFSATVGKLDPSEIELVALYGLVESDVKSNKKPETNETVTVLSLGLCSEFMLDASSLNATFPLWSETETNYYIRLALATNLVVETDGVVTTNRVIMAGSYSSATKSIHVSHAVEANTLLYIVTANPKVMCYGDEPLPLDYPPIKYAGQTEGWGAEPEQLYPVVGEMVCYESTNEVPPVAISSTSPSGNYPIMQGTLNLENGGPARPHWTNGVEVSYQYKLTFSGATYTITNAVFTTTIADVTTNYTGDAYDSDGLVKTLSGVRNEQPVTYFYRVGGAGEWSEELPEFVDVGNYNVQFKASAPNHDDVRGSFKVMVAPAPLSATISTTDFNYTGDPQVPAITTNVVGLVRGDINLLTCEFRDESGEWMSEVPSFTQPGTYKLYFRVSAPNHATFTTNCTFTIAGWDYPVDMDGKSGRENALQLNVSNPRWLLTHSGITGVEFSDATRRYGYLNEAKPNGLKLWQNYVIGQTNMEKKLVATILQREAHVQENQFLVHFPNIEPLRNTGLAVKYRLDRKLKGESEFTLGEISDKYEMGVSLSPGDPTGLYRFNIVLLPTNGLGEAVLDSDRAVLSSVATIGVMRVSSVMTNTVIATPWRSMSSDIETNVDVSVSDVVNPNGLSDEDEIWAYNKENGKFNTWKNNVKDGVWDEVLTVTKSGVSSSDANDTKFPLGKAFWLVRSDPSEYIYLVGRYTGEDYVMALEGGTTNAPGHTLVANPTFNDVDLNSLVFVDGEGTAATPAADDRIIVMNIAGLQTIYYRNKANTQWGRNVTQTVNGRRKQVWSAGGTIPAGTGFWYNRTAEGSLNIKFESVK